MIKKLCCILSILFLLSGCAQSGNPPPDAPPSEQPEGYYREDDYLFVDKTRMFGIAEPLYALKKDGTFQVNGFHADVTIDLLRELGVKTLRLMMPVEIFETYIMFDRNDFEIVLNRQIVDYFKEIIDKLKRAGIRHLVGQTVVYPKPEGFSGGGKSLTAPSVDDECYENWCLMMEEQWYVLASAFPEIRYFQVANETNTNAYLSRADGNTFSLREMAQINADMLYYASKGIKRGNPNAYVISPGYTSFGCVSSAFRTTGGYALGEFLPCLYETIRNGTCPTYGEKSSEIDDYFNVLALHPYVYTGWENYEADLKALVDLINAYDAGRKLFISEVGWPDLDDESLQREYGERIKTIYEIYNRIPQLESACWFRLYNCNYASAWGSNEERFFGMFTEPSDRQGFLPKPTALSAMEVFGDGGDLYCWSDLDKLTEKLKEANQ